MDGVMPTSPSDQENMPGASKISDAEMAQRACAALPLDQWGESALIDASHPRPWNWLWVSGHIYLTDANGRKIAAIWGKSDEKTAAAELIIRKINAGIS